MCEECVGGGCMFFKVLRLEPRDFCMLDKHSAIEPYPQ